MNDTLFFIGLIGNSILIVVLAIFIGRRLRALGERQESEQVWHILSQWFKEMNSNMSGMSQNIQHHLTNTQQAINSRLDHTAQLMRLLNQDLGQITQIGQQMRDFQQLLRAPQTRGPFGEQVLNDLLYQVLPRQNIRLQHRFKNGAIVDALVITEHGTIPIDAKFPLENFIKAQNQSLPELQKSHKKDFSRDVRHHIDEIQRKYILPQEGTLNFAVMYIPVETIYYEMVTENEIMNFAHAKGVLILSPNIFYYFLRVILLGLEGQQIERAAQRILQALKALNNDVAAVSGGIKTTTLHLNNAKNALERLTYHFMTLEGKYSEIQEITMVPPKGTE